MRLNTGRLTIRVANQSQRISLGSLVLQWARIEAPEWNTDVVALGDENARGTFKDEQGILLYPRDVFTIERTINLFDWWVRSGTASTGLFWIGELVAVRS